MMKYDKNIDMKKNLIKNEDEEDVAKSMANLILNQNDKFQRLEKSLMTIDTAVESNIIRPSMNVG